MQLTVMKIICGLSVITSCVFGTVLTNGMLHVSFPDYPVLSDEGCLDIRVTVTNLLDYGVHILHQYGYPDLPDGQLAFRYNAQKTIPWYCTNRVAAIEWKMITNTTERIILGTGQSYQTVLMGYNLDLSMCAEYMVTNFYCILRVDQNLWVQSNTTMMEVVSGKISDGILCLAAHYAVPDGTMLPLKVYRNEIKKAVFLFSDSGRRLCRLSANEVPSFAMNTNAAILTVTLPVSRKTVRYYPRTGRIEEEAMP